MKWLDWVQRLQAIAQDGLTYTENPFDVERYKQLRELAAEIAAEHTNTPQPVIADLFEREEGYATPKLDCRAAVFRGDRILLVQEKADGLWTLPGGWIDVGESPSEAVAKEAREEAGYEVRPRKLIAVHDRRIHNRPPVIWHIYKLFFLCDLTGEAEKSELETDGVGFFAEDDLPPLSTGKTSPEQIALCYKHYRNRELPTEYD